MINTNMPRLESFQIYTDIHALNDLKLKARNDREAAIRPVAEQFEAIFVQQILKEARKVQFDEGWLGGSNADFYQNWHDKQLAQSIAAKGGLGLADKIVEQLTSDALIMTAAEHEQHLKEKTKNEATYNQQQTALPVTTQNSLEIRNLTSD